MKLHTFFNNIKLKQIDPLTTLPLEKNSKLILKKKQYKNVKNISVSDHKI